MLVNPKTPDAVPEIGSVQMAAQSLGLIVLVTHFLLGPYSAGQRDFLMSRWQQRWPRPGPQKTRSMAVFT
jgi:hypothetical protein